MKYCFYHNNTLFLQIQIHSFPKCNLATLFGDSLCLCSYIKHPTMRAVENNNIEFNHKKAS